MTAHAAAQVLPAAILFIFLATGCYTMTDIGGNPDGSLVAVCPPNIHVIPSAEVELEGGVLPAGSDVAYAWDIVEKPAASSVGLQQAQYDRTCYLVPDVIGVYRLRLTVTDGSGASASCEVNVAAANGSGLHVELFWNPPEIPDDRSNADLHLLHEDAPYWFHYLLDCHWSNCTPFSPGLDWDTPGPEGDPALDPHESEGFGPEIINVSLPVDGRTYTVGVHYYQGNGLNEADIFVKIFCGAGSASPAFEAGPVRMRDYGGSTDGNDFWKAAEVTWDGETGSTVPIGEMVLALAAMYER